MIIASGSSGFELREQAMSEGMVPLRRAGMIKARDGVTAMEDVLRRVAGCPRLPEIVVDVASVKVKPLDLMARILPSSIEVVGSHPMFGPQSGRDGIANLKVVLCPLRTTRLGGHVTGIGFGRRCSRIVGGRFIVSGVRIGLETPTRSCGRWWPQSTRLLHRNRLQRRQY